MSHARGADPTGARSRVRDMMLASQRDGATRTTVRNADLLSLLALSARGEELVRDTVRHDLTAVVNELRSRVKQGDAFRNEALQQAITLVEEMRDRDST